MRVRLTSKYSAVPKKAMLLEQTVGQLVSEPSLTLLLNPAARGYAEVLVWSSTVATVSGGKQSQQTLMQL